MVHHHGQSGRNRSCVCVSKITTVPFLVSFHGLLGRLSVVYLHQNKKKAKTEGKKCHAKTMGSKKKPIYLI